MDTIVSILLETKISNKLIYTIAVNTYTIGHTIITLYTILFFNIG